MRRCSQLYQQRTKVWRWKQKKIQRLLADLAGLADYQNVYNEQQFENYQKAKVESRGIEIGQGVNAKSVIFLPLNLFLERITSISMENNSIVTRDLQATGK